MKTIFIFSLILIVVLSVNLAAQEKDSAKAEPDTIVWNHNLEQALAAATQDGRFILIEFYADW